MARPYLLFIVGQKARSDLADSETKHKTWATEYSRYLLDQQFLFLFVLYIFHTIELLSADVSIHAPLYTMLSTLWFITLVSIQRGSSSRRRVCLNFFTLCTRHRAIVSV
jgi:hypothetical protein